MKHLSQFLKRILQWLVLGILALVVYAGGLMILGGEQTAHALPEFSTRTGEPCATCHVSAGGGGPRTMRGLLWSARGRPDEVPRLPGMLIAPNVEDGLELYDIACAGCHGYSGEGSVGIDLARRGISRASTRSFIVRGISELDMPAFDGQFTNGQLEALVDFVVAMGQGDIPLREYPLPPPEFACESIAPLACGGE